MRSARFWLGASMLMILDGCGAGAIGSSQAQTSSSETETTGPSEPLEPPDCGSFNFEASIEGPLTGLAGTEPGVELSAVLAGLDTIWWQPSLRLSEQIEGQTRETEFHVDGLGGALVIQWLDEVPIRAEHCALAPAEFFTACADNFDAECAELDNWLGPCTSEAPTCPSANDCGGDKLCPTVQLGEDSTDEDGEADSIHDPSCVWTTLRDADPLSGRIRAVSTDQGWNYEFANFHFEGQGRNVGLEHQYIDDVTGYSFLGRCELRPAAFFQACLDDPEGNPDCHAISTWFVDCIEAPLPCAE